MFEKIYRGMFKEKPTLASTEIDGAIDFFNSPVNKNRAKESKERILKDFQKYGIYPVPGIKDSTGKIMFVICKESDLGKIEKLLSNYKTMSWSAMIGLDRATKSPPPKNWREKCRNFWWCTEKDIDFMFMFGKIGRADYIYRILMNAYREIGGKESVHKEPILCDE